MAALPVCFWPCLGPTSPLRTAAHQVATNKLSFAQAVSAKHDIHIPVSQLPKPCIKGDALAIKISESEYQKGVAECTNLVHGRLILSKGDAPVKISDLRNKLVQLWQPKDSWTIVPLGRGFYELSFSSPSDQSCIRSRTSWNLSPGVMRLSSWSPDFNPYSLKQVHAQVWIRLHGLSREYWRPKILFEIAAALGNPLALDKATLKRTFGHFARVLVEIDLTKSLHDQVLVEREGYEFFVDTEYENLPLFCDSCHIIGHSKLNCKKTSSRNSSKSVENMSGPRVTVVDKQPNISTETNWKIDKGKNTLSSDKIDVVGMSRSDQEYQEKVSNVAKETLAIDNDLDPHIVPTTGVPTKDSTVESLHIDKSALVEVNNIVSNGADQEHSSSTPASSDNLVQHCEMGIQHSSAGLDEQNLNKDVEQAIHDVFGSASNINGSSFVVDSVGDMEEQANLLDSVAPDSEASDSSNEEVVSCTPVHVAQRHGLQDSVHAENNKPTSLAHHSQLASAYHFSPLNNTPVIVKDLSSFSTAVQNDFKVLSAMWATQKDASTSKEEEHNIDNAADDGFTMVKSKPKSKSQKPYNLRLHRKPNSRFT